MQGSAHGLMVSQLKGVMPSFWTGNPLCRSVDFSYVRDLCAAQDLYPDRKGVADLIGLSIVFFENLSPHHGMGDLPEFGGTYLLDRLDSDMLQAVRGGRSRIFIDYSGEAAVDNADVLHAFHAELKARGISPRSVIIVTCNHAFGPRYRAWAEGAGVVPAHSVSYDHFLYHQSGTMNVGYPHKRDETRAAILARPPVGPDDGLFVCLNNMPRTHRFAVATLLFDRGLHTRGRLSFLQHPEPQYVEAIWTDVASYLTGLDVKRGSFDALLAAIPITADRSTDHPRGDLAGGTGDYEMYGSTRFSIVTESDVETKKVVRITEKILKPIANGHVFINVGSCGGLAILRSHGYETFSDVIDESYDEIEEGDLRFAAVMREVLRLAQMDDEDFNRLQSSTLAVRLHNFDRLWSNRDLYRADPIHAELARIVSTR